ncbi:DUF1491 family protein [Peteryoungia desertarenae]|uniref:DUF1491 family protein n=1 Tax=Peteryoungia desertarenae TaxID=1813451 RepID=A0ABX6QMS6_9HYPH|nr:DUF1491 family protein [Peteryoungia desertarenae]QLF69823.1 DUF1491 family protein [Peteryoungia desertarenae]
MRIRSDIFVAALIRRVFGEGGFAAVLLKGADASGAIFIRQRFRDGLETLYGPAPQSMIEQDERDDRLFEIRLERVEAQALDDLIERERRFDGDLWLIEIEADETRPLSEPLIPLAERD